MAGQTAFDRGKKLFDTLQFNEAKPFFEQDLAENPMHLEAIECLGDCYVKSQNWNKALIYYQKLKKLKPTEANYFYKFGGALAMKVKASSKWFALNNINDVIFAFEKTIQLNPKHIEARWALIQVYLEIPSIIGGSELKAQKYADELMSISKVDGFLAKGHIDEYYNRYVKAELNYKSAFEIGNSKTTFQKLYTLYLNKLKDITKARHLKEQFEHK